MGEPHGDALTIQPAGRLRRNYALLGGVAGTFVACAAMFVAAMRSSEATPLLIVGLVGAMMSGVGLLYTLRANPMRKVSWSALALDEVGLRLDGELIALRREILRGFHLRAIETSAPPAGDDTAATAEATVLTEVRLERRWPRRPIELLVKSDEEGRALLRGLGLDASQTVATFKLASLLRGHAWAGFVTWILMGAGFFLPMLLIPMLARTLPLEFEWVTWIVVLLPWLSLVGWVFALSVPSRIVVGTDGILVSWMFRKRFVPYERVRGVRPLLRAARGLCLLLHPSGKLNLPVRRAITADVEQREAAVVIERVTQAVQAHRATEHGAAVRGALPDRAGRDAREWVHALRRAGSGGNDDHRTAAVRSDVLWRVVEDPAAPPQERAVAAVALSATLDDGAKQRIRIAAEATAAPEIRAVLEAVAAEADEAELARAVRRL